MSEYTYNDAKLGCASRYLLPAIQKITGPVPSGSTVADLGCGNGSMLAQFRNRGWNLHGLEMSRSGLEQAARNYPEIRFEYADLTTDMSSHSLAGKCDLVISTEVVEHVFLPRVYAKNCHTLLSPGGLLIISTPYHGYLKNVALALSGSMDKHFTALWDYGHIKFWSQRTLTSLLSEAGFVDFRFVGVGRVPFIWKSMILVARKPPRQDAVRP